MAQFLSSASAAAGEVLVIVPALETVEAAAAAEAGTREHWRMHAAAGLADEILEVVKLTMQHLFTFLFSYTKVY